MSPAEDPTRLGVSADPLNGGSNQRAKALAAHLGLPLLLNRNDDCDLRLVVTPDRLELRAVRGDLAKGHGVYSHLEAIDTTSPAGRSLNNPLLKAVGVKKGNPHRPRVLDCTAGLCEDAWLMSAFGCTVDAFERQPVIAALARDGIDRAGKTYPEIAARITLHNVDAIAWPGCLSNQADLAEDKVPDAVVLDPMFPLGRKATERKAMRMLRLLAGDDDDADDLLAVALTSGAHRVAVKRPSHAPPLQNKRGPDVVHRGRAVRFDVYVQ